MDQQITLLATQAADEMSTLDVATALKTAFRGKFGNQMDNAGFVEDLLVNELANGFRRKLRASAMDPEQNEMSGQESMFPRLMWVVYTNEQGAEVYVRGAIATVDQVQNHYSKSHRENSARAKRAQHGREKAKAMTQWLADNEIDPTTTLWSEAVETFGAAVLTSMKAKAAITSA